MIFLEPTYINLLTSLVVLTSITWKLQGGGVASPIMDCDETFNYFEALHYLLHQTGLQTWEYAAQYGLRSWFYIELHSIPIRILNAFAHTNALSHPTKIEEFLLVRVCLHLLSCMIEAFLCSSVAKRFGSNSAWLSVLFLGLSSGMGHARRAFLPSSTCMMAFAFAQACWLRNQYEMALLAGSFAVLIAWPFSALPFIPIGLHALAQRGFLRVLLVAILSLILFGFIPALVDSRFYGKATWPTLQMILYNALGSSGGGAHLYGVEDWTYYFKNLFLNFNVLVPISFLAAIFGNEKVRLYHGTPLLLVMLVFQVMAHKEERFLFMIYPSICWSAAVLLAPGTKTARSRAILIALTILLLFFSVLSVGRNLAISRLRAPAQVFEQFTSLGLGKMDGKVICLGREWHRFPSSFFVPDNMQLSWVKSDFQGILPQPFSRQNGYARIVPHMNDMNKEEPSRYIATNNCDFVVDTDEPYQGAGDVLRVMDSSEWIRVGECFDFAELQSSKQPFRSFAFPFDIWKGVTKRSYCVYKRK
jgi:alpha-1,2-mannosyltransferase